MNEITTTELINRLKRNDPNLEQIQDNSIAEYNILFDSEDEIISPYFKRIKQLIAKKPYSVTLSNPNQIDYLIDLIGDNNNIQQLQIDSTVLNTLIQTKLYLLILPLVQRLNITGTLSNLTNDFQLEKFKLKHLIIEIYDPQFKKDDCSLNFLIGQSESLQIKSHQFKKIQLLGKEVLEKHTPELDLHIGTKSIFDNKLAVQCFNILNECKNIKKVRIHYPFVDKTLHIHQYLQQLNKEISINITIDQSSNLKQLTGLLKNQKNVKEISYNVQQKLKIDDFKGLKFFDSSSITSLSLQVQNKSFLHHMLEELATNKVLKNQITHFTCLFQHNSTIKFLNNFLENNTTLKCLQVIFQYIPKIGRISQETIPLIKKVKSLNELSIQFKQIKNPQLNEIYSQLASLNVNKLNLLQVNLQDFIQDNVISSFRNNKSLVSLFINFEKNPRMNYQQIKVIYDQIQMNNNSNLKVYVSNFLSPFFDCHLNNLMNLEIDCAINRKIAFNNVLAPQMSFQPDQIYLDLYYD